MSRLDVVVYLQDDIRQGPDCAEMKTCEECGKQMGVFVFTANTADCIGFSLSGERFDKVNWDHWKCIGCNHQWTEMYGVRDGS